jgi:hypothetical protein
VVGNNELWFNLSYTTFGMMLTLAPRSQRAWSNWWEPMEHEIVGFLGPFFFLGSLIKYGCAALLGQFYYLYAWQWLLFVEYIF